MDQYLFFKFNLKKKPIQNIRFFIYNSRLKTSSTHSCTNNTINTLKNKDLIFLKFCSVDLKSSNKITRTSKCNTL